VYYLDFHWLLSAVVFDRVNSWVSSQRVVRFPFGFLSLVCLVTAGGEYQVFCLFLNLGVSSGPLKPLQSPPESHIIETDLDVKIMVQEINAIPKTATKQICLNQKKNNGIKRELQKRFSHSPFRRITGQKYHSTTDRHR